MRLLDLFCGAGGAAVGYARAGFELVGVDINPQRSYPFEFHQADALEFPLDGFDVVHASPTCQTFSVCGNWPNVHRDKWPDLVSPMRDRLHSEARCPFVIENVAGAPIRKDLMLCGEMFGLRVHRHRYFEVEGVHVPWFPHERHRLKGGRDSQHIEAGYTRVVTGHMKNPKDAMAAMGVDWMRNRDELAAAIPPAYTHWIGDQIMKAFK